MPPVDLFHLFRRLLALVCGVYAALQTCRTVYRWGHLDLPVPHGQRLKRYAVYRLLRIRLRDFSSDLLQILLLLAILVYLIHLHL